MPRFEPNSPSVLDYGDNTAVDAFGRARVSSPESLFNNQFTYDTLPLIWETVTSGSNSTISHSANISSVIMTVGTGSTHYCLRQSRTYFRYQPGKSLLGTFTFVFGTAVSNVTRRVGYYDDDNGIYFEQTGNGTLNLVLRSKSTGVVVNNTVPQVLWNIDTMQGNGPSKINLDITKAQIFWFDLQWLGMGRVRCGFNINGIRYVAHQFLCSNVLSQPYMSTANLPTRYEILNTATSVGASMTQTCTSLISEGGFEFHGSQFTANNNVTTTAITTRKPLLSIAPKITFNGITNRGLIVPRSMFVVTTTNSCFWELVYSGSLTNSNFKSVDGNSIANFDTASTAISGGIVMSSGYISVGVGGSGANFDLDLTTVTKYPVGLNKEGTTAVPLSLVCTSMGGTSNVAGSISWEEQR